MISSKVLTVLLPVTISNLMFAQKPNVSNGTIKQFENFPSKYVVARNIDVWLPPHYSTEKKYSVLYMQDGKGLFDSTIISNKQEWGVDETLTRLLKEGKTRDCIVVGIWNSEATRQSEYFPQKAFDLLTRTQQETYYSYKIDGVSLLIGTIQSDNYLKFVVRELKPFIDTTFSVYTDLKNTFIAGSSYGGLISLYAICEYPNVFGRAACLSTHWPGLFERNTFIPHAIQEYLETHLPDPANHKIYFDYGTATLDSLYKPIQQQVDKVMKSKGYNKKNWMTKEFIGADHTERSWSKRLSIPLTFILDKTN